MYGVLSSTILWKEIEKAISSKEEQIVFKVIDDNIDVVSEFEKIGRTPIKYLIIDLTAIQDQKVLLSCIRRYRVLDDKTRIIMITPNLKPPEPLIDSLVKMGIYDIYNPQADNLSEIEMIPGLIDLIENPLTYRKAVRWIIDFDITEESTTSSKKSRQLKPEKGTKEVRVVEEKVQIIEKEVTRDVEVLGDSVITLVSNAPTGKSYIGWNLSHALEQQGYKIAYVNTDLYNSSNFFFGLDDDEPPFENIVSKNKNLQNIIDGGSIVNDNLVVYTGEFGKQSSINKEIFSKFLGKLRADNDIVIIDPASGLNENLMIALQYSNTVIVVSDLDYSHLEMNLRLLDKIKPLLNKNKTIGVINNVQDSENRVEIAKKVLKDKDLFKEIVKIRNAGPTTYNYINTGTCNYLEDDSKFTEDLKVLLDILRVRNYKNNKSKGKSLLKRIFKK